MVPVQAMNELKYRAGRLGIAVHKRTGTRGQYLLSLPSALGIEDEDGDRLNVIGCATYTDLQRLMEMVQAEVKRTKDKNLIVIPPWMIRACWQRIEDDRWGASREAERVPRGQAAWDRWTGPVENA